MKKVLIISLSILAVMSAIYALRLRMPAPSREDAAVSLPDDSESVAGVTVDNELRETIAAEDGAASPGSSSAEDIPAGSDNAEGGEAMDDRVPLSEYSELLKINPYIAGWLRIDDSVINSPVVYTPKSQNYFLHRDLDGSDAEKGSLFIAALWQEGYHNTLIYGHNMKDGSGFGSLGKYSNASYGKAHPVIRFDTLYEEREYELLGAFFSQIEEEELERPEDRAERDRQVHEEGLAKKQEEMAASEAASELSEEASEAASEASEEASDAASETSEGASEGAGEEEGTEASGPERESPSGQEEPEIELTLADLDLAPEFPNMDIYRMEKDADEKTGAFRYYYFTDLTEEKDYNYFVEHVKKASLYDTGVSASFGDELLTLSTCSYHARNGRFIVVAKRVK